MKMEEELKTTKKIVQKLENKLHEVESRLDEVNSETLVVKGELAKQMTSNVKKDKEIDCLNARIQILEEFIKPQTVAVTSNITADVAASEENAASHSLLSAPASEQSSPSSPPITTEASLTPNKEKKKVPNSLHIELVSDSQSVTIQPKDTGRNNAAPAMHFVRTSRPPPSQPSGNLHPPHQPLSQRFPKPLPQQTEQVLPFPSSLLPSFPPSSFPPSSHPPGLLHTPTSHRHPSQHPSATFSEVLQTQPKKSPPLQNQQDSRSASLSHNPSSSMQAPQDGRKKQLVRLYGVCYYDGFSLFV